LSAWELVLLAPLSGQVVALEDVPDPVFAEGLVGAGCAILPSEGALVAPATAVVSALPKGNHAVGLTLESGVEVILHVGLETVQLKGEGFEALVKKDQQVEAGQPLLRFDLEFLAEHAASLVSPVVTTAAAVELLSAPGTRVEAGRTPLLKLSPGRSE